MRSHITGRRAAAFVLALGLLLAAAACGGEAEPTETAPGEVRLPAELSDPETTPDPDLLLPPLEGYATDDEAEPGELEASLDHGSVPYVEVRRRVVLDDEGFAAGEVTVVTVEPHSAGAERYLDHRYGDVARSPTELAGVEMERVEAEPFDALAWTGPNFAVTFERGAERSQEWLEDLARATVEQLSDD